MFLNCAKARRKPACLPERVYWDQPPQVDPWLTPAPQRAGDFFAAKKNTINK